MAKRSGVMSAQTGFWGEVESRDNANYGSDTIVTSDQAGQKAQISDLFLI